MVSCLVAGRNAWLVIGIPSAPRKGSPPYLQQTLESLLAEFPDEATDPLYGKVAKPSISWHLKQTSSCHVEFRLTRFSACVMSKVSPWQVAGARHCDGRRSGAEPCGHGTAGSPEIPQEG